MSCLHKCATICGLVHFSHLCQRPVAELRHSSSSSRKGLDILFVFAVIFFFFAYVGIIHSCPLCRKRMYRMEVDLGTIVFIHNHMVPIRKVSLCHSKMSEHLSNVLVMLVLVIRYAHNRMCTISLPKFVVFHCLFCIGKDSVKHVCV